MRVLMLSILLAACAAHDPANTGGASTGSTASGTTREASAAPLAAYDAARLGTKWTRQAWLEGKWQVPPEQGTLPPVEIDRGKAQLIVRTGAGSETWDITASRAESGGVRLDLRGADGASGSALFVPYGEASVSKPAMAPPSGAWCVGLPGREMSGEVAWFGG